MWFRKSFRNKKEKAKMKDIEEKVLIKNDVPDLLVNLDCQDTPHSQPRCENVPHFNGRYENAPHFNRRYGNIEEQSENFSDVYEMSTMTTYQSDFSIAEETPVKVVLREKPARTSRPSSFMSIRSSCNFDDKYYQTMKRPESNPYSKSYYSYHNLARDRYVQSQKRQSKEVNRLSMFSDAEDTYEKKKQKKGVTRSRSLSARASTFKGFEGIINSIRRRPSQRVDISKPIVKKNVINMPPNADYAENDTILHSASTNGQIDIVRFYAESGRYINHQNKYLNTPLHCAVYSGHSNIVELLLQYNAEPDLANTEGDTPLHIALSNEFVDIAEILIDNSFNLDLQNDRGDTALHIAAYKQMNDIVYKLVEKKANLMIQNNRGNTPLHIALHSSTNTEVIQILLSGVEPIRVAYKASRKRTLTLKNSLHRKETDNSDTIKIAAKRFVDNVVRGAMEHLIVNGYRYINDAHENEVLYDEVDSRCNQVELDKQTEKLLQGLADPLDISNVKGDALIHRAVKYCDVEVLQMFLLDKNVSKNLKNSDGDTILHLATKVGSLEAVKAIVLHQKNLINIPDAHGNTPLHCAIAKENMSIIQHLTSQKCDVNLQNRLGNTPLHIAVLMRRFDILKLLLELTMINPSLKNADGNLPLHCAIQTGNINIIQAVKEISESYLNETNNADENVLIVLLHCKNISSGETDVLLKYLIENNVNYNKQDRLKNTPLHICIERKLVRSASYMLGLHNIQVDLQNLAGDTALHLMAKHNNVDAMKKVHCEGWVFDITNNCNETPLDIALNLSLTEMGELIMQKKWGFFFPM